MTIAAHRSLTPTQAAAMCRGKATYSHVEAERRAKIQRRRYDEPIIAYRCKVCGGWHTGRRPQ